MSNSTDDLFYFMINKLVPEFIIEAERLGLSNEELAAVAGAPEMTASSIGSAFAGLCRDVVIHRQLVGMMSMMRPGEETVSLDELAARLKIGKGNA